MKRVLVNASAAKCGGGVTILNKFTKEKYYDKTTHYVIVSPIKPDRLGSNQTWIKKRTSFISTIMYALFGSWFTCRKYKCSSIISFSNINSLLPISKVTYFHNMLILNGEGEVVYYKESIKVNIKR
ncbi:hypothetical protein [Shewanella woodyi]|uniref:hypothetical protein n=1 Tax=Shewanella woodyi TaxID=60961 RepID=UPI00374A11F2